MFELQPKQGHLQKEEFNQDLINVDEKDFDWEVRRGY